MCLVESLIKYLPIQTISMFNYEWILRIFFLLITCITWTNLLSKIDRPTQPLKKIVNIWKLLAVQVYYEFQGSNKENQSKFEGKHSWHLFAYLLKSNLLFSTLIRNTCADYNHTYFKCWCILFVTKLTFIHM
jgi:hypothetical protein